MAISKEIREKIITHKQSGTSVIGALGNGEMFKIYVETQLTGDESRRHFDFGQFVVHKMKNALQPLLTKGVTVRFLPRYSPDYNQSKIKSILKQLKTRTYEKLIDGVALG